MLLQYAIKCQMNEGKGVATDFGHDANSLGDQQADNASARLYFGLFTHACTGHNKS